MYKLTDIKTIHLEITSKCQASCPMCTRNIQGGLENPWIVLDEITIDQFKDWFPISFIKNLDRLLMCGNRGDPVVAKDTLKIFEYIRDNNTNIHLDMNTNGSARSTEWWKELAVIFSNNGKVNFGIDGLEDTHALYRIGTDWNKIISNATSFINAGGQAIWDMLIFEHNKHQIESCEELSKNLGFTKFTAKHTSRFREEHLTVLTKDGKTSHKIYPSEKSKEIKKFIDNYDINDVKTITCKVIKNKSLYVNASGYVTPCCWLDYHSMHPIHKSRIDMLDNKIEFLNLREKTFEEIFETDIFKKIEKSWNENPLLECSKQCGKIDKFHLQF